MPGLDFGSAEGRCPGHAPGAVPDGRDARLKVSAVHSKPAASSDLGSQRGPKGDEDALRRTLSRKSYDTVMTLSNFRRSFDDIEASIEQLTVSIQSTETPVGRARTELAQLEATLDKLQCKGVDSVETFELSSGKELAKSIRKELTDRADIIHDRIDEVFKAIKYAEQRAQL